MEESFGKIANGEKENISATVEEWITNTTTTRTVGNFQKIIQSTGYNK
ncbi:MAG: hypothetical protein WKF35_05010 [Ferruginibacter sp.]